MTAEVAGPVGREASAATHQVVVNAEEQFSLWPLDRPLPAGWKPEGAATAVSDVSPTSPRPGPI